MSADTSIPLSLTVEFDEVDSYGMVHHSRYPLYAERARLRFLASCGLLDDHSVHFLVHTLRVRYRKPARLLDTLTVTAFPRSWTDFTISFHHDIRRDNILLAALTVELAAVAPGSGEPALLPEPLINRLHSLHGSGR